MKKIRFPCHIFEKICCGASQIAKNIAVDWNFISKPGTDLPYYGAYICHLVREMLDVGVVDFSLSGSLAGLQQPHGKAQHAKNAGWRWEIQMS